MSSTRLTGVLFLAALLGGAGQALPACPELVGQWGWAGANSVAVLGDLAVFGAGSVLMTADVSDPSDPEPVASFGLGAAWGTVDAASVRVRVPPEGRVLPYASVVDNATGDSTFVPARRMP